MIHWNRRLALVLCVALAGCAGNPELPADNATGADAMKPSPCACIELDYDGSGFIWRGPA